MWLYTRKHVRRGEKRTRHWEFERQRWCWVPSRSGLGHLYQGLRGKKGELWLWWDECTLRKATEIVTTEQDYAAQAARLRKDIDDAARGE